MSAESSENEQSTAESGHEECQPTAIEVLKALSHFEYPEDVSRVEEWLQRTKPLQDLVKSSCGRDRTGQLTYECVNVVFDLMATQGDAVSPAIWDVLEMVEEEQEIKLLTETFVKESRPRLKNRLNALLSGTCLCGQRIPRLQDWCFTFIQTLEERQKYSVLLAVPQGVVMRLLQGIVLPYARKVVFAVFERLLYPMTYPQVFNIVMEQLPEMLPLMVKDEMYERFCWLMKTLAERFPQSTCRSQGWETVTAVIAKQPVTGQKPSCAVWSTKPKVTSNLSSILECPVCYERFVTPITVCENGHCICSNCKCQLRTCPLCRALFSDIRMTIIDQIMEITEFHCKNADAGCKVRVPYKDIWNHEMDCEYRTITCDIVDTHHLTEMLCNEDVVAAHFHDHVEKCHKNCVARFELNVEWRGEVRRYKANEVRLLKNAAGTLCFLERIYVTDEEIFFSYHYVGKKEDADGFVYTVEIHGGVIPRKIVYTNFCLPNYMSISDTEVDERCFVLEPGKIFDAHQTKLEYSVRIEDFNVYRMRLKKNKLLLSK